MFARLQRALRRINPLPTIRTIHRAYTLSPDVARDADAFSERAYQLSYGRPQSWYLRVATGFLTRMLLLKDPNVVFEDNHGNEWHGVGDWRVVEK